MEANKCIHILAQAYESIVGGLGAVWFKGVCPAFCVYLFKGVCLALCVYLCRFGSTMNAVQTGRTAISSSGEDDVEAIRCCLHSSSYFNTDVPAPTLHALMLLSVPLGCNGFHSLLPV